jgi:hypothetical protein
MASVWLRKRPTKGGETRYRVEYRVGGRESRSRYAGAFPTKRGALARKAWFAGELANMRVPNIGALVEPAAAPLLRDVFTSLHADGKARESIRKSVTALAMVLDFAGVTPNPAHDRVQVRLPREEPVEMEPPSADHVEAVGWLLVPDYLLPLLVLDATGVRVGELEAATQGDLGENRKARLVRAAVAKTRRRDGSSYPTTSTLRSSSGYRRARTAGRRRRCSVASRLTGSAWRSVAPAGMPACRGSARTRSVTAASPCCTGRASHGRRSASGSGNARSSSPQTRTRTRSATVARSTGQLLVRVRTVPSSVPPSSTETASLAGAF